MDPKHTIYTTDTQCQDCYKCVRECPVKAIRIEKNHANILPELCTSCGRCVEVCPAQAKNIRDDIGRTQLLLHGQTPVYASIAPSWICEFPGITEKMMIAALKQLGFAGVSETAVGAEIVSTEVSNQLSYATNGLLISSACPAVVEWIRKYQTGLTHNITQVVSPLLAHCRHMRNLLGNDIKIVFFGPCVAKKLESDNHKNELNIALTFRDLRKMFEQRKIQFSNLKTDNQDWVVAPASPGRLYPAEGGMLRTLDNTIDAEFICVSGIKNIQADIEGLCDVAKTRPVFLEALACSGGCINGPAMTNQKQPGLSRKIKVFSQTNSNNRSSIDYQVDLGIQYNREYIAQKIFSDAEITNVLRQLDKYNSDDELNCGGCGYETCREFAKAMLHGKAEPEMCVSYMRKKAQKKANALLRSIPSGVVIVNKRLEIIECNKPFSEMFDDDAKEAFEHLQSLEGAQLDQIVPFADLFRLTLQTGKDVCRQRYMVDKQTFNLTIFSIQPGQIAGAVIQDVTEVQWRRQQIARDAREVLRRNLATVQDIANKLGEHMADNEVLLSSIANSYSDDDIPDQEVL